MNNRFPRHARGLTLIELAIVLAIVGIVLSAALPSLQSQLRQGRRLDAMQALAMLQLAQERWRAERPAYADDLAALGLPARSPGGHYALAITQADARGYTIVARAQSAAQRADRACATLQVQQIGGRMLPSAQDADGVADPDNARRCWVM